MKIIGIDSSGLTASVALIEDDKLIAVYSVNYKKTHSQTLLPMLDEISKMTELDINTVDAIAISEGPGSFTGLRIGSSTAKGLGLALNIPIVEIPTTAALAYNMYGTDRLVCPIMDARREQVYTGLYDFAESDHNFIMNTVMEVTAEAVTDTINRINEIGRPVVFLGDGVSVYKEVIEKNITVSYTLAPSHMCMQNAASVAELGRILYLQGKYVDAKDHVPEYLRLSQAERERNEAKNAD